jgi:lipopolysaccharide/colanic/teichoic acid biosynthesis glycosyltransferase
MKAHSEDQQNEGNILFKPCLSEYVPPFCRWLRRTGLDELPQILNVLKGEMSLVGPRPLTINDLERLQKNYPGYYYARDQITIRPGITGMWQVFGQREKGLENLILHDLFYTENTSLALDTKILGYTAFMVSTGKHSDAIFPYRPLIKEQSQLQYINQWT